MTAARLLKRVGLGLLIAVGGVLTLVGVALAVLHTGFGGERVRRFVLPKVNQTISGQLDVGQLGVHGAGLELRDVVLRDPEGAVVAELARLDVALSLRGLFGNRIDLSHVDLERPRLHLVQSARGLNLARAVAPKEPSPEAEKSEPSSLVIVLRRLRLADGSVSFHDTRKDGPPEVALAKLEVDGSGEVALATQAFTGKLRVGAQTSKPLQAPLSLTLDATGEGAKARGKFAFDWGAAKLALAATSHDERRQDVVIDRIVVPPELVAAFAPGVPLATTVTVQGRVGRRGERVDTELHIGAAATQAQLAADVDVERLVASKAHFEAKAIDLSRLLKGGPPSHFDVLLEGNGGGRSLAELAGKLNLQIPQGKLDGRVLGPVRVQAGAQRGNVVVDALEAALPGVSLSGAGKLQAGALSGQARVKARDLGLTARSLRLPRSLGLAGSGDLAVTLGGRLEAPSASVTGRFPHLRGAGQDLTGVTLTAQSPNLRRAPVDSKVQLAVQSGQLGGQNVHNLALSLVGQGEQVSLKLSTSAPLALSLDAGGRVAITERDQRIDLDRLSLSYPQTTWQLVQPAHIVVRGNDLTVSGVDLRAADQRIALDVSRKGTRLNGKVAVARLDLARLPAALLPPDLAKGLAGRVDVDATVSGPQRLPEADVRVALQGGKVGKLADLGLRLEARHQRGRLTGQLAARALGSDHQARFDLPAAWPPAPEAPLLLQVQLGEVGLAQVGPLVGQKLDGRVTLALSVEGPARDPALSLKVNGRDLALGSERIQDLALVLDDPAGKPLRLSLQARVRGRPSRATLDTPVVLGRWLRDPPTEAELQAAPFVAKVEMDELPLAALTGPSGQAPARSKAAPVDPRAATPNWAGTVSASAAITGPVNRLHGTVTATATQVSGPRLPPTDASLRARLGEGKGGLDAKLLLTRRGRNIADIDAAVGLGIDDLLARKSLASAPIKVKGTVGPLGLQRLVASAEYGMRNPRVLRGLIEARLAIDGTLGDPRADVRVGLRNASLAGAPLGTAELVLAYAKAQPRLVLDLASANGGKLNLTASARVDLGLPALQRGLVVKQIPLESKLKSKDLDLRFLSTLDDSIRAVEGKLDADASVNGLLGAPQIVGKVGWKQGRLVLSDYGELRDIALDLHGDTKQMVLDKLFARAGNGTANLTGRAVRQADDKLMLEARAKLDKFRIETEGQALGALSLSAGARGSVAPDKIEITTDVDEAHFELQGGDRRRLQALSRPAGVVLLENGEPIDRKNAERLKTIRERQERQKKVLMTPVAVAPPVARAAADERPTRIFVSAPRNLWVRGDDANIELGLDDGFSVVDSDELRLYGTVRVRRGFVEVLGRRFDITGGSTVVFAGPANRPTLAVDAKYRVGRQEGAETTVTVRVEGPADALSFSLRSPEHPEFGDTELMSIIATGRAPDEAAATGGNSTSPSGQAASVLGGLLADKVQKALVSRLPIDVLTIQPGEGLSGARLEAGTYFGDDIYVAYVGHLGVDAMDVRVNRNELHLEYQLTSRWSFEATYGDARQGSFDLLWTRHY